MTLVNPKIKPSPHALLLCLIISCQHELQLFFTFHIHFITFLLKFQTQIFSHFLSFSTEFFPRKFLQQKEEKSIRIIAETRNSFRISLSMPRSSSGIHHQRQNSDNFILDANYHGRWFHPSSFAQVKFPSSFSMEIYKVNWIFSVLNCMDWIVFFVVAGIWYSIFEFEEEWWWSFVY